MIIKGKSRSGPTSLADHLGNAEKNEQVQLLETKGTIAQDLHGALVEMAAHAAGTRCEKPLYHAAISPEPPHRLTPEQRTEAINSMEEKLGLQGQPRVVVLHEKEGREHLHVVWSRIDLEHMRAVPDSHNYRKHEEVSRELERSFGHDRVQGAHHEREGVERPDRTPSRSELRQEERTGITGKQVKQKVSALYKASDGPEAFKSALEDNGYTLAKGDRRDFVIVDQAGGVHSLARRLDGVKAAELRAFMAPLDREQLPNVVDVRRALPTPDDASLEKKYGRGDDYVSQSRAALEHNERLQERLENDEPHPQRPTEPAERAGEWDEERSDGSSTSDANQQSGADDTPPVSPDNVSTELDNIEMTDAMVARIGRLLEHKAELGLESARDGPTRQGQAPGGGQTRGR